MRKSEMHTLELLDMLSSITRKKSRVRGNLRLEAILESTHKWLDHELREKQLSRKRKLEDLNTDFKKCKLDFPFDIMEEDSWDDILGLADFYNNLKSVSVTPVKRL